MNDKIISNDAVVTKKFGDWTQITCRDLPKSHHNHIVNTRTDFPIGTKGKILYTSGLNFGLLVFKPNE